MLVFFSDASQASISLYALKIVCTSPHNNEGHLRNSYCTAGVTNNVYFVLLGSTGTL